MGTATHADGNQDKPTDAEIDAVLRTPIPGGSAARDWFLPHDNPKGLANVRDVVRRMLAAAPLRQAPTPQQVSDYLAGLDAIRRKVVEREARADALKSSEDALCSEWEAWCNEQGLPFESADELLTRDDLTKDQRTYIARFIERWNEAIQSAQSEQFASPRDATSAEAQPNEAPPVPVPQVVIRLDGGLVQDVISSLPVDVMVADYDVEGAHPDDLAEMPMLQALEDDDGDEQKYVPVACSNISPYVDPAFTESLIRTGRGDFAADPPGGESAPTMSTFTVFVQQSNGRGTVHIADYQAASSEGAAAAAIEQVSIDWGAEGEPWDKDDLRVLGILKGNVDVVEWNDLDC